MNKPELFGLFRSMQKLAETKQFEALQEVINDVVVATADADWKQEQKRQEKQKEDN